MSVLFLIYWLVGVNPLEKQAALKALPEIQAVRSFGPVEDGAYRLQVLKAQQAVKASRRWALTDRDSNIALAIELDFDDAQKESSYWKLPDGPRKQQVLQLRKQQQLWMDSSIRNKIDQMN